MLIPWKELFKRECAISGIKAIYQTPVYRELKQVCRAPNGFLLIEKGECRYSWREGSARLVPGTVIYLPRGSRHDMTVTSREIAFTRVDFTIHVDGEEALFSPGPQVITRHASEECAQAFHALTREYFGAGDLVREKKLLCDIFLSVTEKEKSPAAHRIAPALDYIRAHYREKLDVRALAALCFLSTAQMYRLFEKETGCTPLEYREQLRIRHACLLLSEPESTVSEIAALLGYESLYYFSRVFRQKMGLSPTVYRKQGSGEISS